MTDKILEILNQPIVLATLGAILAYGLTRLHAAKPKWAKYEGAIFTAIKLAEKKIPDNTENKGLARLNNALQYVIKVYEEANGKRPSKTMEAEILNGIQISHARLEEKRKI